MDTRIAFLAALSTLFVGCAQIPIPPPPVAGSVSSDVVRTNGLEVKATFWPSSVQPGDRLFVQVRVWNCSTNRYILPKDVSRDPFGFVRVLDESGSCPEGDWPHITPAPLSPRDFRLLKPDGVRTSRRCFAVLTPGKEPDSLDLEMGYATLHVSRGLHSLEFLAKHYAHMFMGKRDKHGRRTIRTWEDCFDLPAWHGDLSTPPVEIEIKRKPNQGIQPTK